MKNNDIKIKICGIRRDEDIEIINKHKPDYIGFVFAESKRQIDFKQAKILKNKLDKDILAVGVFVNSNIEDIKYLIKNNIIDMIQLHGDEDKEFIAKLKEFASDIKIIKAIEIEKIENKSNNNINKINNNTINNSNISNNNKNIKEIIDRNENNIKYWEDSEVDYLLLDSGKGTGKTFNWKIIKNIKKPFFLAGGINSENINEALKTNPHVIDLSSGSEENGFKSSKKIAKIMNKFKGEKDG